MLGLLRRVFGTKNSREVRRLGRIAPKVNELEPKFQALSDDELAGVASQLRVRLEAGETLEQLMPDVFAAVREAAVRTRAMRHYDVQLIGGRALHEGGIAEMRTGEGKTLVETLPAVLNALSGRGVHIVTVNDYLAKRDADWMGPIYEAVGLTVGVIQSGQPHEEKQAAYRADITYGTNNEFGFDYLRDNMAFRPEDRVQRGLHYAIIDEVDSILIDEARTPLIISGPADESTDLYLKIDRLIPKLKRQAFTDDEEEALGETAELSRDEETRDQATRELSDGRGDYIVDEKNRQVVMTDRGHQKVEGLLQQTGLLDENDSLYAPGNLSILHHISAALRAHVLFKRDVDYIIQGNEVVIVDEHTGRTMPGRRWSEGLHQAVEAKEGVAIQRESQTYASTTFQNYFRLYDKLAGMTGTADTEAFEFKHIYDLDVMVVPTNRPMIRADHNDLVFLTVAEKYDAIVEDVEECRERQQPVLIGTASVESSELLSAALEARAIEHNVLNAKRHGQEADIVAQAGRPGAVTIATNMAGRGTDIVLGGNLEAELATSNEPEAVVRAAWDGRHQQVLDSGGLHIVGTERHESRRIDNQLRGRSGRQGDPGSSRFYLSMEDNLMRLFASERMRSIMSSLGMEEGEAIESRLVSNSIEKAQRKVEQRNFDIRKNLLEYDDVANDQRQIIYAQRNDLMETGDIEEMLADIRYEVVNDVISDHVPPGSLEEQWDIAGLEQALVSEFDCEQPVKQWLAEDDELSEEKLRERIYNAVKAAYDAKAELIGPDVRVLEKQFMLQVLDQRWKEHLQAMDHLRQGIHLRAYAQKQPKQEYKRESFELFQTLLYNIKTDIIKLLSRLRLQTEEDRLREEAAQRRAEELAKKMQYTHAEGSAFAGEEAEVAEGEAADGPARGGRQQPGAPAPALNGAAPFVRQEKKVGRNEPCPCGSGKKYKQCHGKAA